MREEASLAAFIAAATGRTKCDVRLEAEWEKADAERFAARTPRYHRSVQVGPRPEVWLAYRDAIKSLLHFIRKNTPPSPASEQFRLFRPLVEGWVRSGEMQPEALAAFDQAQPIPRAQQA